MKINKNMQLALGAVSFLSTTDKPVQVRVLAQEIGSTEDFTQQVVAKLRRAGITVSVRGPGGGVKLNRELTSVSALDVAKALGQFKQRTESEQVSPGLNGGLENSIEEAYSKVRITL